MCESGKPQLAIATRRHRECGDVYSQRFIEHNVLPLSSAMSEVWASTQATKQQQMEGGIVRVSKASRISSSSCREPPNSSLALPAIR